jgi:UDP-glucose 4-epimerase
MTKDLKGVSVLVTGANGFIGSHLTRRLLSLGAEISIFVRPQASLWRIMDIKDKIKIYPVDIKDFETVKVSVKKIDPVKVYHLAAYVDVSRSFELIDEMIDNNIKGTVNVLMALKESNCNFDCFVNTGISEEYGDNEAPFLETQTPNPVSPYSASKVAGTYFCGMMHKTQCMPIVTLRPFLTYGPYQVSNMLIPGLIKKCLLNEEFQMTKGEQTRDVNYVGDIVDGYIKASLAKEAIGEIINLASGREHQVKDVARLIIGLIGTKVMPDMGILPYRAGETMHYYGSNAKAKKLLGWQSKVGLEEGLKTTISWYKEYLAAGGR